MKLGPIQNFCTTAILLATAACGAVTTETQFDRQERLALIEGARILSECQQTRCAELILNSASIPDYTVLNEMPHVTRLTLQNMTFTTLGDISEMPQLTHLTVSSSNLANLDGLDAFENLTALLISSGGEMDTAPLSHLTGLTSLQIHFETVDIGFVTDLDHLMSLHIEGSKILDLAPLAGHPNLRTIDVQRVGLPSNIDPLLEVPELRELRVGPAFSDRTGQQLYDGTVLDDLRSRGVYVHVFHGFISPEINEPENPIVGDRTNP